jgi:putative heme transporter
MPDTDKSRTKLFALAHGSRRIRLPQLAIALGCLVVLTALLAAEHNELTKTLSALGHAKPGLIGAAVGAEWISMVSFARLQRRLLRAGDLELAIESVLAITFAGNALSVSVPIAGAGLGVAFTYQQFERRKVLPAAAGFVSVVSGVVSTVALTMIVAAGALVSGNDVAGIFGLLGAVLIVAAFFGLVLAIRIPALQRLVERLATGVVRVVQRVRRKPSEPADVVVARAREGLLNLHLGKTDWLVALVLALLNWLGDAACLALSIRAAGLPIPFHKLILVWSAGQAAGSLGFTPGGLGVVEVALIAALIGIGLPAAGATASVLIYRLISLWLVLSVGWIFFIFIRSRRLTSETPGGESHSGPFVAIPRSDVTTEEISEILRRGLGRRYRVRRLNAGDATPGEDTHGSYRSAQIVVGRRFFPLFRALVTIVRRPEATFLQVRGGGFTPSIRISNRLWVVRRVRTVLRSALELHSPDPPE